MATDIATAAAALAARSVPVFPIRAHGKKPITENGFKNASCDPDVVAAWWEANPQANVGVPTGPVSGVFVVDIDPDKHGADEWALLVAANGEPATHRVRTPSGGEHIYFRWPAAGGVRNRGGFVPGIDVRGDGGYVLVPPSHVAYPPEDNKTPGHYESLDDLPPADAPEWLLEMIVRQKARVPRMRVPATTFPTVPEGQRNQRLFEVASGCRADGFNHGQILERLRQLNREAVSPSLDDSELVRITDSATRYPVGRDEAHATAGSVAYNLTDLGDAQRLADRHAGNIHWLTDRQAWVVWDGARYKPDHGELVMRAAQETVGSIYLDAANASDTKLRESLGDHARKCEREGKLRAAVSLARSQSSVMAESPAFDTHADLLNVGNGTLDLSTATLMPHERAHQLTRLLPLPYDFEAPCPTWLSFLERIMADNRDMVAYLQRAVGYSLTGHTREHCLFMLYGTGANGKSTFTETLCDMLGEYAMRTQFSTWVAHERDESGHEIAALAGARLVVSNEAESSSRLAEGLVKQATGGDRMRGCFKYQNSFEFVPTFKLWVALNHKPTIRDTDEGIWRRIRLVPFTVTIPPEERDPTLREKLRTELPGILAWAVKGAFEWYHYGLSDPEAVLTATKEYRAEQDVLGEWIAECLTEYRGWTEKSSDLYKSYKAWCERNGMRFVANNKLGKLLRERGFEPYQDHSKGKGWGGYRIITDGTDGI